MSRLLRAVNIIKAPLMSAGRAYNSTAEKYPMLTGVVTTVVKTSAADLFAQKVGKASIINALHQRHSESDDLLSKPLSARLLIHALPRWTGHVLRVLCDREPYCAF